MKILHIFGAVVAVHLAVFLVIFAVPGCRSTGKSPQASSASTDSPALASADASADSSPFASPGADGSSPTVGYGASSSVRFSPTRPGTPAASEAAPIAAPASNGAKAATTTYLVARGDSLWTVAKKNGVSVNELVKANNLKSNATLQIGQKLVVPAAASTAAAGAGASSPEANGPTHTVKGGETLGQIARTHGTTVNTLKRMNKLTSDVVRPGKVLLLPEGSVSVMDAPAAAKSASAPAATRNGNSVKHAVKTGETLGSIARRYGISVGELVTTNNIQDPAKIFLGQELVIPGWSAPKTAQPAAVSAPASVTFPEPSPIAPAESASPLTPVTVPDAQNNSQVPVIRIEDPNRTFGSEAPRIP